jgi:hypothetical protein
MQLAFPLPEGLVAGAGHGVVDLYPLLADEVVQNSLALLGGVWKTAVTDPLQDPLPNTGGHQALDALGPPDGADLVGHTEARTELFDGFEAFFQRAGARYQLHQWPIPLRVACVDKQAVRHDEEADGDNIGFLDSFQDGVEVDDEIVVHSWIGGAPRFIVACARGASKGSERRFRDMSPEEIRGVSGLTMLESVGHNSGNE